MMKLMDMVNHSLRENSSERFDLHPTKDIDDIVQNLSVIAGQSGSRIYVVQWAIDYLNEYPNISKQFMQKYKILDKNDFTKFMEKLQVKARAVHNKNKKKDRLSFDQSQADIHLANIERMAFDQSAEWDAKLK